MKTKQNRRNEVKLVMILMMSFILLFTFFSTTRLKAQTVENNKIIAKSIDEYIYKVDSVLKVLITVRRLANEQFERTGNEYYLPALEREDELIRLFEEAVERVEYIRNFEKKIKNKKHNTKFILFGSRDRDIRKALESIHWMTITFPLLKDLILEDGSLSNDTMVENIPELKFPYIVKKLKKLRYWGYRYKIVKILKELNNIIKKTEEYEK